jgi:hypothetical protein
LGFSNWPVIYYKPTSFLAPSNAIKFPSFIITVPPSEHNKAPAPDGFCAEFYQTFWEVIKGDLMPVFKQLHASELPLFKLNLIWCHHITS